MRESRLKELCEENNLNYAKAMEIKKQNSNLDDKQIVEICKQRETFKAKCLQV